MDDLLDQLGKLHYFLTLPRGIGKVPQVTGEDSFCYTTRAIRVLCYVLWPQDATAVSEINAASFDGR